MTGHQQGFRVIHPSGLPLACDTRSERAPLGFPLSFAPSRYQPRTSGRGRIWNTNPKSRLRHHAEPPIDELTHNVRPRVAPPGHAADGLCRIGAGSYPSLASCRVVTHEMQRASHRFGSASDGGRAQRS